jgi:hypothetical protein
MPEPFDLCKPQCGNPPDQRFDALNDVGVAAGRLGFVQTKAGPITASTANRIE